uniref:Uncharacterized protein n=1 Tax=Anopheles darlingi TaxID=43151 RepID=A0A2M4D1E2_ANODA
MDLRLCVCFISLPLSCVSPTSHIHSSAPREFIPIAAQLKECRFTIFPAYLTYAEISSLIYCLLHMLTLRVPSIVYS